jgi:hypothetical protein
MRKFLILTLVLGMASFAMATPIVTGPDADIDGKLDLDISTGNVVLTLEGTAAEASGAGGSPIGGYSGYIWVDYASYPAASAPLSNVSAPGANMGGLAVLDTTTYMPRGFKFVAGMGVPWNEATDVDAGDWLTFTISMMGGAQVGDTYSVDILTANWGTPAGSVIVEVIPEPMTIALLGLGGLFLRRRK